MQSSEVSEISFTIVPIETHEISVSMTPVVPPSVILSVTPSETVEAPVDATLTIAGMAADAKATGDAIQANAASIAALQTQTIVATVSNHTLTFTTPS